MVTLRECLVGKAVGIQMRRKEMHTGKCDYAPGGKQEEEKADGKGFGDAEEEGGGGGAGDRLLKDEGASSKECDEQSPGTSCVASPTRGLWVALGTLRKDGPCAQAVAPSSEVMIEEEEEI